MASAPVSHGHPTWPSGGLGCCLCSFLQRPAALRHPEFQSVSFAPSGMDQLDLNLYLGSTESWGRFSQALMPFEPPVLVLLQFSTIT